MKRIAFIAATAVIMAIALSSCLVVSLHPLGTEEEQLWKPELLGTWVSETGLNSLIIEAHPKPTGDFKYQVKRVQNWAGYLSMLDKPDPDKMKAYTDSVNNFIQNIPDSIKQKMTKRVNEVDVKSEEFQINSGEFNDPFANMGNNLTMNNVDQLFDTTRYNANIFKVGDTHYFDLSGFGYDPILENFLPVHTFVRIDLSRNSFSYLQLDEDKLADLFEEKHIRLQHEITTDGVTLITASGSKIQEFLKKYTKNPDVFKSAEKYHRQ
jgi:hypothetical protein